MPRKPKKLPDYFTMEEADALILATESRDTRLAMRLMLRCGMRVSEALEVRPSHIRFDRTPPLISLPADIPGNKAKVEREIPIPEDLVELLRDRASGETKARNLRLVEISRQAVGQGMKKAAMLTGVEPARGPSSCTAAYLRPALHPPGRTGQRPPAMAGPRHADHDHALRPLGGRPPFLRGPNLGDKMFSKYGCGNNAHQRTVPPNECAPPRGNRGPWRNWPEIRLHLP